MAIYCGHISGDCSPRETQYRLRIGKLRCRAVQPRPACRDVAIVQGISFDWPARRIINGHLFAVESDYKAHKVFRNLGVSPRKIAKPLNMRHPLSKLDKKWPGLFCWINEIRRNPSQAHDFIARSGRWARNQCCVRIIFLYLGHAHNSHGFRRYPYFLSRGRMNHGI